MTKELYPAPGQIILTCRVTSIKYGKNFTTTEIGTNSMTNVSRDYKNKVLNAKLNSIYKHMNKGGGSDAVVEVIDFDIKYFKNIVKIEKKQRTVRGKKYTYVYSRNKKTGKLTNRPRKLRRGDINGFES